MYSDILSTLKIHKLSREQYERELAAGNIDENALYCTPEGEYSPEDFGAVSIEEFASHKEAENPHNITTELIGAARGEEFAAHKGEFDAHKTTQNPHNITTASIGAVSEEEFDAHKEEFDAHLEATNPHGTTWDNLQGKPSAFIGAVNLVPDSDGYVYYEFGGLGKLMVVTMTANNETGPNILSCTVAMERLPQDNSEIRVYYPLSESGLPLNIRRKYGGNFWFRALNENHEVLSVTIYL